MNEDARPRILVVDDNETNIDVLVGILADHYDVAVALDGATALEDVAESPPALILLDIMMPGMDGYAVCRRLQEDSTTQGIPIIFLSALNETIDKTRGLELGAVDYVTKPFDAAELKMRVRNHIALREARERVQRQSIQLRRNLALLREDLDKAASYLRSLIPPPFDDGHVRVDWRLEPCETVGGDALGYGWVDDDHFGFYMLDVCGHGVGPSLLSASVVNVLRTAGDEEMDPRLPGSVLAALNTAFPMKKQNYLFFTLWYGVYQKSSHCLRYGMGGHPPALLMPLAPSAPVMELGWKSPLVGMIESAEFREEEIALPDTCRLLLFTDGAYEIRLDSDELWGFSDFKEYVASDREIYPSLDGILRMVRQKAGSTSLADDVTLLDLTFRR